MLATRVNKHCRGFHCERLFEFVSVSFYCIIYFLNFCSVVAHHFNGCEYSGPTWQYNMNSLHGFCSECVRCVCLCRRVLCMPTANMSVHKASVCAIHYIVFLTVVLKDLRENNRIMNKKSPWPASFCECFHISQPKETRRMQIVKHMSLAEF